MEIGDKWMETIAHEMKAAYDTGTEPKPERITVRGLLRKYNYSKRGSAISPHIRNKLDELNLRSTPDFETAWFDERITISLNDENVEQQQPDPTHRISILDAAHRIPVSVSRDAPISVATTLMIFHDYSQLPVMQGAHDVKGIISWKTIGSRLSLDLPCRYVHECMEQPRIVAKTTPLFDVIGTVADFGYVLIQESESNSSICGIVTASDLSNEFAKLAGPFLLSGQIEGHLRNLVHGKFSIQEIQRECARPGGTNAKPISGAADLTLGDYHRLLSNPERWKTLNLNLDRGGFLKHLDAVREIRNNVMHFNPEGLSDADLQTLNDAAKFFDSLVRMGAIL